MKKSHLYVTFFFVIWALILVVAIMLTLRSTTVDVCRYYDEKIEAANLTAKAYQAIKDYKIDNEIELSDKDIHQTGVLGERYTVITTTLGILEAKRTSINPNFSAVVIDMFKEAGIKKGDEVGVLFSGSFPALNIATMAAIEVFELKPIIMASIGSSSYGANIPEFTYYDMAGYLCDQEIFTNEIDYVSLGGANDLALEFPEEVTNSILDRINSKGTKLIYEEDYSKNIKLRTEYIYEKCPNIKLLINVGGNLVSMGKDESSFIYENGLIKPNYIVKQNNNSEQVGLLENFLEDKIPVIQLLNIKSLSFKYGIPYDPTVIPVIGEGNIYNEINYNITIPILALSLSGLLLVFYFLYNKKYKQK